ncbi:MAG TPA: ABC transporter ATP-binding protein [Anaerolineales bacterium]|nr:ABC transporter ATP-binding protein [Anaerolineales bacterium]
MSDAYAVELRDIVKRFGTVTAVNHVNLKIKDGEFFSLLGPSGCGKTTTLRMIAGFELPTSGEILIGNEVQGYLPAYKRPVNTVFQNYALFPHMTVSQNVAFGLEMQKIDKTSTKRRVQEALDLVHLGEMGHRRPKQLSGGQQQRVALARALVNHPKVLLLDEPLGALDLKLRKAMQVELKALQVRVGITFVYVTHDQEEALTMSDRIGVMDQGKLLQVGTAHEVYETPNTRFVSDFIGDTNYLDGHIESVHGKTVDVIVDPHIRIKAMINQDIGTSRQASVAFRPEKLFLNLEPNPENNQVEGIIQEVIYTGSATTFLVVLPNGVVLTTKQQNMAVSQLTHAHPGDKVTLSWPVEASRAFVT